MDKCFSEIFASSVHRACILKTFFFSVFLLSWAYTLESQVELVVRNDIIECGEEFTAEIYVNNFDDVYGLQFTLEFDENFVEYLSISTNLPSNALFDVNLNPGVLLVTYATFNPMNYPDGTVIFEVDFNHIGTCGDPFIIHLVNEPLGIEVSNFQIGILDHLVFGAVFLSSSDCNLEVDAGEDFSVCEADLEVILSGDVLGNYFDFFWSPEDLVFPRDQLTTTATVPETTTFTLTGRKETENIVYNDHFDFGYVGFYSDYDYNPNDLSGGNAFAVANSPDVVYASFPGCSDHTGNNGSMLIVNGVGAPPQNAWCQYIEVEEGTTYVLGAFINTMTSLLFPQAELQFQINGEEVGDIFDVPDIPCFSAWEEMNAIWTATESGTIDFCIFNHQGNVSPIGNGFIIDDISFVPLCEVIDEVEVEVLEPAEEWIEATICAIDGSVIIAGEEYTSATEDIIVIERSDQCDSIIHIQIFELELNIEIDLPEILSCTNSTVEINASSSTSGPEVEFIWSTSNGNIVSGQGSPIITVDQPEIYTLILHWEDDDLSCFSEEVSIEIIQDINAPDISLNGDTILNCSNDLLEISVETDPPGTYNYSWTTFDGNITGNTDFPFIILDAEGTYFVEVTNPENGCSSIDSVLISSDFTFPIADAGPNLELNCMDTLFVLGSNTSSQGSQYGYAWTTSDGNFTSSTDSLFVSADQEGTYILEVFNSENGCSSMDTVEILDERIFPDILALPAEDFGCLTDSLWIGFELLNGSGMEYTISWTTSNGSITGPSDSLMVLISSPGDYQMEIVFEETGCVSNGVIVVEQDDESPVADAGANRVLNCINAEVQLDGSNSSSGPSFSLIWTTTEGNIVSGENGVNPVVDAPAWYFLEVVNNENGCVAIDSVMVLEDFEVPEILVEGDTQLTCLNQIGSIEAIVSNGESFSMAFNWSTPDGNIIGSTDSSTVIFDEAGEYHIEVIFSENGCSSEIAVVIDEDKEIPIIDSISGVPLTCADTIVELTVFAGSQQSSYEFFWSGPAGGISGDETEETISVVLPGWYSVTITDEQNGCQNTNSILVELNVETPQGQIFEIGSLNCIQDEMQLLANFQPLADFAFEWATVNGNIVSGGDQNEVTINSAGTYVLTVTDIGNGCTDSFEVEIAADLDIPFANAGGDTTWTCADSVLVLDGSNSTSGPDIIYSWSAQPGSISGSNDQSQLNILGPGTYILELTNQLNGCTAIDTAVVNPDEELPTLVPLQIPQLNCGTEQAWIGFEVIQNEGFSVVWNSQNGEILSAPDSLWILVGSQGEYTISVTFSENNCTTVETVSVEQDITPPLADAGPEVEIGCDSASVLLDGSNSATGPQYSYSWTTENGNIIEGDSSLTVLVDQPGLYVLSVFNSENGCIGLDSVEVISNDEFPEFSIGGNNLLTCTDSVSTLFVNLESTSLTPLLEWFYNGDPIAGSGNQDSIAVFEEGIYSLIVTFEENQCSSVQEINVQLDTISPSFNLMVSGVLSCLNNMIEIIAEAESDPENFHFQWGNEFGPITNPGDPERLIVDSGGAYFLLLTNLNTGCLSFDSIAVEEDYSEPEINLIADEVEGCGDQSGFVELIVPLDAPYIVEWSTLNGSITEIIDDFSIQIDTGGVYYAFVTNSVSGCSRLDSVIVSWNVVPFPTADAGPDFFLSCSDTLLTLDGSGSDQGDGFSFSWTSIDGNIVEGANSPSPVVNSPGTYVLEVVNQELGCASFDTAQVFTDDDFPYVEITRSGNLDCSNNLVVLDASFSDMGIEFEANWQGTSAFTVMDSLGYIISVMEGGEFVFQLTNTENGCYLIQTVVVEDHRTLPIADGGENVVTGCSDSSALLMVPPSIVNDDWLYRWEALEGEIFSNPDSTSVFVSTEGVFVLQVLDLSNNCEAFDTVLVINNSELPIVHAGLDDILTCERRFLVLDGSLTEMEPHYIINWTTIDGNILSGDSSFNPTIDAPGTYVMSVFNPDNGCMGTDSVFIGMDTIPPMISAGENLMLNCQISELRLSGNVTSDPIDFFIEWSSATGNILSGGNSLNALINQAGTYVLSVSSIVNGCSAIDSVLVGADFKIPEFGIEGDFELNCLNTTIDLRVELFSEHEEVKFLLKTQSGDTLDSNDSGFFVLDQSGARLIEVVDLENQCGADTLIWITENFSLPEVEIKCIDCDPCGLSPTLLVPETTASPDDSLVFNWIFESGVAELLSGDTLEVFEPTTVSLSIFNPVNGCLDTLEYTLETILIDFPEFIITDWDCNHSGGSILFEESDHLEFSIDGGMTYFSEGSFEALPEGTYLLRVNYIEFEDCESEMIEVEIVDKRDQIDIFLPESIEVTFGEPFSFAPVFVPGDIELSLINWEPADLLSCNDCLNPVLVGWPEFATIILSVETPGGCEGNAVVTLRTLLSKKSALFIPNAFSPNADGVNDRFYVHSNFAVEKISSLEIFDRWGSRVFQRTNFPPGDPQFGWDGTFRDEEMSPGLFVVRVSYIDDEGREQLIIQDMLLIR